MIREGGPCDFYELCWHEISLNLLCGSKRFKDVCASCLCASLLQMQFMSQFHAMSCTSVHANEEIYSHEGMVVVALTLLRFNLLE